MHSETNINLGRALAEVILGVMLAIALHLRLPEVAVARLRARMEALAQEWGDLYLAWLAKRLAPPPAPQPRRPRATARRDSAPRVPRIRRAPVLRPVLIRPAPARAATVPCAPNPARAHSRRPAASVRPHTGSLHAPTGQPRKNRAWPAVQTCVLFVP